MIARQTLAAVVLVPTDRHVKAGWYAPSVSRMKYKSRRRRDVDTSIVNGEWYDYILAIESLSDKPDLVIFLPTPTQMHFQGPVTSDVDAIFTRDFG